MNDKVSNNIVSFLYIIIKL